MFVFNRPLSAVAAGLGVALLIACLDRLSHPLEALHDAPQRTSRLSLSGVVSLTKEERMPTSTSRSFLAASRTLRALRRLDEMNASERMFGFLHFRRYFHMSKQP